MPERRVDIDRAKNKIISLYVEDSLSIYEISKKVGASSATIHRRLKEWGIPMRGRRKRRIDKKREEIISLYQDLETTISIGEQMGVHPSTIERRLREWGVDVRPSGAYPVNESVFDELTAQSCYWIGYLAGDGNVYKSPRGYLILTLYSKDRNHLKKFKRFLSSGHKIKKRKTVLGTKAYYNFYIRLSNERLCRKLIEYGIVPNKSKTLKITKKRLLSSPDFLRGIIDSDGSISATGNRSGTISIHTASNSFRDQLVGGIWRAISVRAKVYKNGSGHDVVISSREDILAAIEKLYGGVPLSMTLGRKQEAAYDLRDRYTE